MQEIFQKDESSVLRLSLTAINCQNDGMLQENHTPKNQRNAVTSVVMTAGN